MKEIKIRDVMTENVATVRLGDSLSAIDQSMQRYHVRHLPVVNEYNMLTFSGCSTKHWHPLNLLRFYSFRISWREEVLDQSAR
jgi:CBS-domain-containing membrane protein